MKKSPAAAAGINENIASMIIGTVKQIWRYPVKSMSGELLADCTVGELGIPGDRGWALRDEETREITNGKHIPLLMKSSARYREEPVAGTIPHVDMTLNGSPNIGSDEPNVNKRLSEGLDKTVSLWPRQPARRTARRAPCCLCR